MADGTDLIGDTWIYLVIAHEWAHAIQNRLDLGLVANGRELQADCLGRRSPVRRRRGRYPGHSRRATRRRWSTR